MSGSEHQKTPAIPAHLLEFSKEVAALAKKYELNSVNLAFQPGYQDDWRYPVTMDWSQGRHGADAQQMTVSSHVQVVCPVPLG